jgi:hypothetical protein
LEAAAATLAEMAHTMAAAPITHHHHQLLVKVLVDMLALLSLRHKFRRRAKIDRSPPQPPAILSLGRKIARVIIGGYCWPANRQRLAGLGRCPLAVGRNMMEVSAVGDLTFPLELKENVGGSVEVVVRHRGSWQVEPRNLSRWGLILFVPSHSR